MSLKKSFDELFTIAFMSREGETLRAACQCLSSVEELDFSKFINFSKETFIRHYLKYCVNVKTITPALLTLPSASALAEGLKSCTNLLKLNLRSSNITSDGAAALAEGLNCYTNLQTLNLGSNNIGSDWTAALVKGLNSCPNLQTLNLRSNNLGSDEAAALAEGLKSCTNTQTLNLCSNNIGSGGNLILTPTT